MKEQIDRIIIAEDKIKANLKRNTCPKCGRIYFMAIAADGSILEPCPVCLGLFGEDKTQKIWEENKKIAERLADAYYDSILKEYAEHIKNDSKENFGYNAFADGINLSLDIILPLLDKETLLKAKRKIKAMLKIRKKKNEKRN